MFSFFPRRCCREASFLLAKYLKKYKIETVLYYAANDNDTHAWLIVKDARIKPPIDNNFSLPEDIRSVLSQYSGKEVDSTITNIGYIKDCFASGLIIDITADQYEEYYSTIYVGFFDDFHDGLDYRSAHDYVDFEEESLANIYSLIESNIEDS